MEGTAEQLFDFIANCVSEFMRTNEINVNDTAPLGFTFSFPVNQTGLASGNANCSNSNNSN
jgi:hexokinase